MIIIANVVKISKLVGQEAVYTMEALKTECGVCAAWGGGFSRKRKWRTKGQDLILLVL